MNGNKRNGSENNEQVAPHFLQAEKVFYLAEQKQAVSVKVDAEQYHKYGRNPLQIRGIAGNTVIPDAEAAGSGRTETGTQRIKKGHSAEQQKNDLGYGQTGIDQLEDPHGVLHLRDQLANRRTRAFRFHYVHILRSRQRQKSHNKDQHSHSAHPMSKTSPHEH